ncbi:hypothetical protein [Salipiger abyssi]|uniref:Uncharacterized protein n=1 Tax=Salipiger abyssi TaxID=1250539 RepID=A0A1P8UVP6_9RHOB|nr:hypothetical protein [Salipiger abyssi]APZ53471.1 hypothetical protein Ga0080574_TMP3137 [Salipiger abyssi]
MSKLPGRTNLPEIARTTLPATRRARFAPFVYAGGLLAIGTALLVSKPRIGKVPEPRQMGNAPRRSRLRRAAQHGRDGAQAFAPSNVTDSVGRSLILGGVALLAARALDELSGRDGK